MTSRDFCYWLQGFFEVANPKELTAEHVEMVRKHLNLVFVHEIDPSFGGPAKQDALNAAHAGKPTPMQLSQLGGPGPGGTVIRC